MNNDQIVNNYFNAIDREHYNKSSHLFFEGDTLYSYGLHFILAQKIKSDYILNGDSYSVTTSQHQSITRYYAPTNSPIIPFSALANIFNVDYRNLNPDKLRQIKIIDVTNDKYEKVVRKDKDGNPYEAQIHHLGASLIKYFLSGIDENSRGWNAYFLVQLKGQPQTVEEAFRDLAGNLTDEQYELVKEGKIQRQGEYFLIPTDLQISKKEPIVKVKPLEQYAQINNDIRIISTSDDPPDTNPEYVKMIMFKHGNKKYNAYIPNYEPNKLNLPDKYKIKNGHIYAQSDKFGIIRKYDLSNGEGNAHIVTEAINIDGELFVRGTLRHREHYMINMGKIWHKIVKNTAVNSWAASGNVD